MLMKKRNNAKKFAYLCALLILVLVMLYSGLRILESTVLRPQQGGEANTVSKTITRDGIDYFPRQDITTVLVMGIDRYGKVESSGSYQNPGAADVLMVLVFDETNNTVDVLHLNRDTMVEMPALGLGGRQAGTFYGQLALSHTYGSGLEDSCENVVATVSDLLYGIRIDYYVAMNMDAIAILNDAVGGVTVTVADDFSQVDGSLPMGQVTLKGEQAVSFVRSRQGVGDQLNLSRIERQKAYIDGFADAFRAKQGDPEFFVTTYDLVAPYLVTNCSATTISSMMERYGDYAIRDVISPAGENVAGKDFMEFYLDEETLDDMIIGLFYDEKK